MERLFETRMFLCRRFEFGGTIGNLCPDKGHYRGVYIIVRPNDFQERGIFNDCSSAGRFKGKDPTVSIDRLEKKWVNGAKILYIGKSEESVQKRMQQHNDFWNGKSVPGWGGRIIAQIRNFDNLEVWYLSCDNPQKTESDLLNKFKQQYNKLPFANFRC